MKVSHFIDLSPTTVWCLNEITKDPTTTREDLIRRSNQSIHHIHNAISKLRKLGLIPKDKDMGGLIAQYK